MSQRNWVQEFGREFDVPALIAEDTRFVDTSWHNEVCPHFQVVGAAATVSLWVDHPDDDSREMAGWRYVVTRNECDQNDPTQYDDAKQDWQQTVYAGDDAAEAVRVAILTAEQERAKYPALSGGAVAVPATCVHWTCGELGGYAADEDAAQSDAMITAQGERLQTLAAMLQRRDYDGATALALSRLPEIVCTEVPRE